MPLILVMHALCLVMHDHAHRGHLISSCWNLSACEHRTPAHKMLQWRSCIKALLPACLRKQQCPLGLSTNQHWCNHRWRCCTGWWAWCNQLMRNDQSTPITQHCCHHRWRLWTDWWTWCRSRSAPSSSPTAAARLLRTPSKSRAPTLSAPTSSPST